MTDESNRPSPSVPLSAASLPPLADLEATTSRETGMPEEQPQAYGQTSQQRGFDPSIYRPVSMGGLVKTV